MNIFEFGSSDCKTTFSSIPDPIMVAAGERVSLGRFHSIFVELHLELLQVLQSIIVIAGLELDPDLTRIGFSKR